jgi:hypothetical protein
MRVCIPELLQARGLSAYMLAVRSNGRISESTAYRLVEMNGELQTFGADILAALLEVLDVTPNVLFGWEPLPIGAVVAAPKGRKKTAAKRRRAH